MEKNKKNGFTLAEMLICMGILGTLIAILIPALQSVQPNQNKILLRKSYQVVERTVNILINDDTLYPEDDAFANSTYGGAYKFCKNFQDSLNLMTTGTCPNSGGPAFIGSTPDGVYWYFTAASFTNPAGNFNNVIAFDVNGPSKTPNCATTSIGLPTKYSICASGKKPDLFKVGVRWDGKLHLGGKSTDSDSYAIEVLNSITNNLND